MTNPSDPKTTKFNLMYYGVFTPLILALSYIGLVYMVSVKTGITFAYSFQLAREAFGI